VRERWRERERVKKGVTSVKSREKDGEWISHPRIKERKLPW